jgi:hypothetical protein
MNDKDKIMQVFGFAFVDCDGKTYKQEIQTPGATWHECMDAYVKFLESVFGYPIKHQVRLEEPQYLSMMYDSDPYYLDPWTGEYFTKDEPEDELTDEYGWGRS